MVVFGLRKVLAGTDGRFCELTASRASVAPQGFEPTRLEAGTITYRSSNVIAGVPPLGTRAVKARETVSGKPRRRCSPSSLRLSRCASTPRTGLSSRVSTAVG